MSAPGKPQKEAVKVDGFVSQTPDAYLQRLTSPERICIIHFDESKYCG
jgi:hypothetical protein